MAVPCVTNEDDEYPLIHVSTDSPEDTENKIYGNMPTSTSVNWDARPDLVAMQLIMPPVHVHFPVVGTHYPGVRVWMPVLCLIKKPD